MYSPQNCFWLTETATRKGMALVFIKSATMLTQGEICFYLICNWIWQLINSSKSVTKFKYSGNAEINQNDVHDAIIRNITGSEVGKCLLTCSSEFWYLPVTELFLEFYYRSIRNGDFTFLFIWVWNDLVLIVKKKKKEIESVGEQGV